MNESRLTEIRRSLNAVASLNADELVVFIVGLQTDVLTRLQRHEHELHVRPGEEHPAKVLVGERVPLDVP